MYHRSIAAAVFCALVTPLNSAHANVQFFDFSSTEGIQINGDAHRYDNRVRLTASSNLKRGSIWFVVRQSVDRGFDATFQFQISACGGFADPTGRTGGDGLAFVIQNSSLDALGGFGADIGYGGASGQPAISNSLAIEFDTWFNAPFGDPDGNHVSVHTRGLLPNDPNEAFSLGATTGIPDLKLGDIHTVGVKYDPGVLRVFVDNPTSAALTVSVDLASILDLTDGRAWIGFTASTWDAWENHDILNASFTEIPEPSTLALLWLGVSSSLVLRFGHRRRKNQTTG